MMALHSCDGPLVRRVESVRVADVINVCAKAWDVEPRQVLGEGLIRQFAHPRLATYWIANRILDRSSVQIGGIVGRDHSTVLSGAAKADQLLRTDFTFRALLLSAVTALGLPQTQVPPKTLEGVN
jgi:chromosomal replication initiation ATPase DnaA